MSMVRPYQAPQAVPDPLTHWAKEYFRKNGWIVILTVIVFYYSKKLFLNIVGIVKYYTVERWRNAELDRERERVRRRQLEEIHHAGRARNLAAEGGPASTSPEAEVQNAEYSPSVRSSDSGSGGSGHKHGPVRTSPGGSRRRDDCDDNNPFGSLLSSGVGPTGIKYRPRRRGRY